MYKVVLGSDSQIWLHVAPRIAKVSTTVQLDYAQAQAMVKLAADSELSDFIVAKDVSLFQGGESHAYTKS